MTLRGISSNWSFTIRHFSKSNTCLERLRPVAVPSRIAKSTKLAAIDRNKLFVDWLRVRVVGGDGGNGALSLLRYNYQLMILTAQCTSRGQL
jgi:hypothetical protein